MILPMRCSRVRLLIDDHVDGILPAAEAETVRDHLDRCRDCRELALASKAASTSLAVWGDHEPPNACFDAILCKIDALPADAISRPVRARPIDIVRTRARRWVLPTAAAAAAVAGVAVVERVQHTPARRGEGPISASLVASSPLMRTVSSRALRPGEQYVHIDRDRYEDGVRRLPASDLLGNVRPLEASLFATPR